MVAEHPGAFVRRMIEESGWSVFRFAKEAGIGQSTAHYLIKEKHRLRKTLAGKLSEAFMQDGEGPTAEFFLWMQEWYDEEKETTSDG